MSTRNIQTCLSVLLRRTFCYAAILSSGIVGGSGFAAPAHSSLPADDLDLSVPCAQVRIEADPALKDGVELGESSGLVPVVQMTRDGAENHLRISLRNCPKGGRLTLRLSGDTALTLHDSPQAHITITGTLSTLESNLEDASLRVDRVESLDMSLSGTAQVQIHQLDRAAQINATGNARLDVDLALLSALSAQLSDSSQLDIAQGQIDSLTLTASSHTGASIMAQINNANITTNDAASVMVNKITGTVQASGTKHIVHTNPTEAAPTAPSKDQATPQSYTDGRAQGLTNPSIPNIPQPAPRPMAPTPRPSETKHNAEHPASAEHAAPPQKQQEKQQAPSQPSAVTQPATHPVQPVTPPSPAGNAATSQPASSTPAPSTPSPSPSSQTAPSTAPSSQASPPTVAPQQPPAPTQGTAQH